MTEPFKLFDKLNDIYSLENVASWLDAFVAFITVQSRKWRCVLEVMLMKSWLIKQKQKVIEVVVVMRYNSSSSSSGEVL